MIGRSRSGNTPLPERLDALRSAIDLADGRLDADAVAFGQNVIAKADERLRHGTTHTLVALLGATGAGKSSLTNALVGAEVATTGVRRPTTSSTMACVWGDADTMSTSGPLLDWLEVDRRHLVAPGELGGLVLLDVPDHDSVEVGHRLEMERIAEHCDLMVWVTDPEKYADAALHRYLSSLAGHDAVTVLVLNKTDRLDPAGQRACEADLARLAVADGINDPAVISLSASTGDGVERLRDRLAAAVRSTEAMASRLQADVAVAASEMARSNGAVATKRSGDGVDRRAADRLAAELVDATGIAKVTDAVAAGTKRDAAAVMGWPYTRWARRLRPHPLGRLHLGRGSSGRSSLPAASAAQSLRVGGAIRTFVDGVSRDLDDPWPQLIRAAGTPRPDVLTDRLDRAVADGVRTHAGRTPRWWSLVGAIQVALAVAAAVGFVWLTVLFALQWFQIPDPPTPEWRGWPIPTLLFGAGVAVGLLVAVFARRVAGLSARRAARRTKATAIENVGIVANELVVDPVKRELADRGALAELLERAGADKRLMTASERIDPAR